MRKISNREEANGFYSEVRSAINKYVLEHKVEPKEIREYIINNLDSFISRNNLSDIRNIKQIVIDVLDHKVNRIKDTKKVKVMESHRIKRFKYFEKLNEGFFHVDKSGIDHEKALADYFNTSLGHIEEVDTENHIYSVSDFGKSSMVVIFSSKDLEVLTKSVVEELIKEISDKNLILQSVQDLDFSSEMSVEVREILDKSKLEQYCKKVIDEEVMVNLVRSKLEKELVFVHHFKKSEYLEKFEDYHIWQFVQ
jgi:hypothetical protein